MQKIKIYGAGSIGNHLANAARTLGCGVDLCDVDPQALERTRTLIYPGRYQKWDPAIGLHVVGGEPKGGYDLVCIGTPPDSHIRLARAALAEKPAAVLVEKPLCPPNMEGAEAFAKEAAAAGVAVFVGYDHVVGQAAERVAALLAAGAVGRVLTLDVEFREHWGGIFAAHPWLSGPADTYLGYWRRGGGALGEHSHALNLWQYFAHAAGLGQVIGLQAALTYVKEAGVDYDSLCLLHLQTARGLVGRVVQDVVTAPPRKWARIQGSDGFIEWEVDRVRHKDKENRDQEERFARTRPDDFIRELRHIDAALASGGAAGSPLRLERALETMQVIAAAHRRNGFVTLSEQSTARPELGSSGPHRRNSSLSSE